MTTEVTGKFHPLANTFPLLEGDAFAELIDDIRANGLNDPVIIYEGQILDGRNRWRACQFLGIPHREKQYKGEDAAAFVWSSNAVRRQLTPAQRAMAATKIANVKNGGDRKTDQSAARQSDARTISDAAEMAKVGKRSILRANKVIKNAVPGVVAAVESGELALSPAERLSEKPKAEQEEIMRTTPVKDIPGKVPGRRVPPVPAVFVEPVHDPDDDHIKDRMARQMTMPETVFLRKIWRDWQGQPDVVRELDHDALYDFTDRLRKTHYDLIKLINFIEETMSPDSGA